MARRWSGGHSGAVLCVGAAGGPDGLLASGGEGGELTLWAQDGALLSTVCLRAQEDVTCVAFSTVAPGTLYASHGDTVSALDPRNTKAPAWELRVGEDEINALSLNETGELMAVADDSGAVRVVELPGSRVSRTLRRHTNICSSVAFRPKRPNSLVSAGLDMQVMLWNLQKARPMWTVNLQEAADIEDEVKAQMSGQLLNPPLAYCVSVATCGNVLACGAEDGRVHLLRAGAGPHPEWRASRRMHSLGVSQAHFLSFLSHPYWLATGGNDAQVALWDISGTVAGAEGMANREAPRRKHKSRQGTRPTKVQPDKLDEKGALSTEMDPAPSSVNSPNTGPKLSFNHGDKVNWLCPTLLKGEPCLLVADQSSALTVYSLCGL